MLLLLVMTYFQQLRSIIFSPSDFFKNIDREDGYSKALKFAVITAFIGGVSAITTLATPHSSVSSIVHSFFPSISSILGIATTYFLGLLLLYMIGPLIIVSITYLFVFLVGGRGSYKSTYKIGIYSLAPTVLGSLLLILSVGLYLLLNNYSPDSVIHFFLSLFALVIVLFSRMLEFWSLVVFVKGMRIIHGVGMVVTILISVVAGFSTAALLASGSYYLSNLFKNSQEGFLIPRQGVISEQSGSPTDLFKKPPKGFLIPHRGTVPEQFELSYTQFTDHSTLYHYVNKYNKVRVLNISEDTNENYEESKNRNLNSDIQSLKIQKTFIFRGIDLKAQDGVVVVNQNFPIERWLWLNRDGHLLKIHTTDDGVSINNMISMLYTLETSK